MTPANRYAELVERLRRPDFWTAHFHNGGSLSDDEEGAPFEAATVIAELAEENSRLLCAISWVEAPFVDERTSFEELKQRVALLRTDAKRASLPASPDSVEGVE